MATPQQCMHRIWLKPVDLVWSGYPFVGHILVSRNREWNRKQLQKRPTIFEIHFCSWHVGSTFIHHSYSWWNHFETVDYMRTGVSWKSRVPICSNDSAEDWVIRNAYRNEQCNVCPSVFGHVLKVSKDLRIWAISTGKSFLCKSCVHFWRSICRRCFWCLPVMVLMIYHCYDLFRQQGNAVDSGHLRSPQ